MDRKKLEHLKLKLKLWEKEFQAKNGKQPTPRDIDLDSIRTLYKEYRSLKSKACDGGEYHSLKSKTHNGGNASCFGTDSRNSVFGAHLNKEKSLKGKKSTFSSANTKTLTWSKHNGWTTYQSVCNDSTTPQNDYQEENIFDSLLTNDDKLKILCENSQSSHQPNTVNVVTTKRNLKFGNSVSAEWMEDDQLSTVDVSQRDEIIETEVAKNKADASPDDSVEPMDYTEPNQSTIHGQECTGAHRSQSCPNNQLIEDLNIDESSSDKQIQDKSVKIKSSVSENYVRLNLKKSRFSRGGAKKTGSYYKRQEWKKKKSSVCFKCGQAGHWAKSCTQTTSNSGSEVYQPLEHIPNKLSTANHMVTHIPEVNGDLLSGEPSVNIASNKLVEPLYCPQETEHYSATPEIVDAMKLLGYDSFRMKQSECIMRILSGISTLLVLPTGTGKSLCYQLPAYLFHAQRHPSITLVVSPLISLIENQMKNLPNCLEAVAIHSGQSKSERTKAIKSLRNGNIAVVMTTPEMIIESASCINSFLHSLPPVAFICLDEVHCIAEWSHNFRPSYLRICKVLRSILNVQCFLGLTATATQQTIECIRCSLGILAKDCLQNYSVPSNLTLSVSCVQHKEKALVELLQDKKFKSLRSVIIYCNRQQTTERIAQYLRTRLQYVSTYKSKSLSIADCYHAGLSTTQRKRVQADFMSGSLNIVVATVAFGMGINKQDVRAVIHYDMPNSFEAYVQEIGRAGRDGLDAFCHTFISFQDSDLNELKKHIYANSMDRYMIKHLVSDIFSVACDCSRNGSVTKCKGHLKMLNIPQLVIFLDLSEDCIITLLCILESKGLLEIQGSYPSSCVITNCGTELKLFNSIPVISAAVKLSKDADSIKCSLSRLSGAMDQSVAEVYQQLQLCNTTNSTILVTFSASSFFVKAFGDMSDDDKDELCNQLHRTVQDKENNDLRKLHILYTSLKQEADDEESSSTLKSKIFSYFSEDLDNNDLHKFVLPNYELTEQQSLQLKKDIKMFLSQHSDETFTGRAIARILYGISSPKYPAHLWGTGRNAYYWRRYLDVDFSCILKTATLILTGC